jgi:hypothetical protein
MEKIFKTFTYFLYVATAFMMISCAASQHAGITYIHKPSVTETNESVWLTYWQDQFDAYSGNVIVPDNNYPEAAKQAYQQAKLDWDKKADAANTNKFLLIYGGGTTAIVLLLLVITGAL